MHSGNFYLSYTWNTCFWKKNWRRGRETKAKSLCKFSTSD